MSDINKHIVLVGDSIFDNGSYVPGEPDVAQQLRNHMGDTSKVTLLAIDGDVTTGVKNQLKRLPEDATHLFISVGGNDALGCLWTFSKTVSNIGDGFLQFNTIQEEFHKKYSSMIDDVLKKECPTTICTIYRPCFSHQDLSRVASYMGVDNAKHDLQRMSVSALSIFNDVIFEESVTRGLPLMDLRTIYTEAADYANPIEPSTQGGQKMVTAIERIINNHPFDQNETVVYTNKS